MDGVSEGNIRFLSFPWCACYLTLWVGCLFSTLDFKESFALGRFNAFSPAGRGDGFLTARPDVECSVGYADRLEVSSLGLFDACVFGASDLIVWGFTIMVFPLQLGCAIVISPFNSASLMCVVCLGVSVLAKAYDSMKFQSGGTGLR